MKHKGIVISILFIGTLTSCSSHQRLTRMENYQTKLAQEQLKEVDKAMRMYREADPDNAFPEEDLIQSYGDLWKVLVPYVKLPWNTNTHWTFISYQRPSPGTYMIQAMVVRATMKRFMVSNGGEVTEGRRGVPPTG